MRVSPSKLQQMAIYTTLLAGVGCCMMYYLLQVKYHLENFSRSDHHRLALEQLEANQTAMDILGAPPPKVHNIHLSDRHNHIKILVTGCKDGGYLNTSSVKDPKHLGR
ncbi:unnamed protein product [Coregonus sp. 'balchen']|nr:unnamed protein product [Coregonus sp. 'balchen']